MPFAGRQMALSHYIETIDSNFAFYYSNRRESRWIGSHAGMDARFNVPGGG